MTPGVGGTVAAVLAGLLILGSAAAAAGTSGTVTPTSTGMPVDVLITSITPQVLAPGSDLRIRATLHNTGTTAIPAPRVTVHLGDSQFISRSSLDTWRAASPDAAPGPRVLTVDLAAPLAPGASAAVDLVVPAASINLSRRLTSWGARGLAVLVTDAADPGAERLGVARTFALWFPEQEVTATRLSILVPITGPPIDPEGDWMAALDESTRPGGRLSAVLAATADHREVTWVVDPWLVDAAPLAGGTVPGWSAALLEAMTDREVHLLPYADPDLAALAHAGAGELLTAATDRAHDVVATSALPDGAQVAIAWPADALPDLWTATLANRTRAGALLVGPGELPSPAVLTYTPTGRTEVTASGDEVTVLVPDGRLSGALVTGRVGAADAPGSGPVTGAIAAQDLLAELAVITRERPADARHMLVTVPRTWTPDPDVVEAQLSAILEAPWVHAEPVTALIGAAEPEVDRGTLPAREVTRTEVSPAALDQVRTAVTLRERLATIVPDPETVLGDLELELLAPASVAWRGDPLGRSAVVSSSRAATAALRAGVSVPPAPEVNLVSTSGDLPVDVVNTLTQEVTVLVALVPGDRRLIADEAVPVTVPPGSMVTVAIPVHAVQSADVDVMVELRTAEGTVITNATHFTVRVRAEWESIGAAVMGGLLGIGLMIGLIRTVRRGRAVSRTEPQALAGPDTLSPEEDAELGRTPEAEPGRSADTADHAETAAEPDTTDEPDATEARYT
jgi:hypothetical protein